MLQNALLCGRVEADSGNKNNTLFLDWNKPVYSSNSNENRLEIWRVSKSGCY